MHYGLAPDIMRHSAASHLYKLKENPTYVTAQMGHGLGVFMKHYKRAVPETEAQAYFNVLPTDEPPEAEPAPNE